MQTIELPVLIRLRGLVETALKFSNGLQMKYNLLLPCGGMDSFMNSKQSRIQARLLLSSSVMLSPPSPILRASPTPHDALPDPSLKELIAVATRVIKHDSWVTALDNMGSPKLPCMAFPACDRRDTEEAAPQVDCGCGTVIVFA
jgi:hypothetical protein